MINKLYPNYEVHPNGDVYNIKLNKKITPILKHGGYLHIRLSKDGRLYEKSHHRFVYETLVGDIPERMEINHINGIKTDNRIDNLELCTHQQNNDRRLFLRRGESVNTAKLTDSDVIIIRNRKSLGESSLLLAKEYNVSKWTINKVFNRTTWKHI